MAMRKAYSQRTLVVVMAASVALGGLGFSHSASANTRDSDEVISAKVRLSDLDLSTDKGDQEVLTRIHRAARSVCIRGYEDWSHFGAMDTGYIHCVKDASNRAVADLNNPMVTAAYTGHKPIMLAEAKTAP